MTSLLAALSVVLGATAPLPDGGSGFVSADGGDVPVVAPGMTPSVAGALAPELVPDGGQTARGLPAPVLAPKTLSVYRVDLPSEAALTAGLLALDFMIDVVIKPTLATSPSCLHKFATGQCDPADLSGFDRYAVGRVSKPWQTFSDIAVVTAVAAPAIYLGLESLALPTQDPLGDFFNDTLVVAESLSLTLIVETVIKFTVRRPRPISYVEPAAMANIDTQLSLPSGHTGLVAAAASALTTTVFMRHPQSNARFVVLGAGLALSFLTGFARVESGQHFPTDTITGLLIGAAAGFVVPFLHRKQPGLLPTVAFDPATGTAMFALSGNL